MRVFETRVREKCIVPGVNGRAKCASVLPRVMYVIMISHVGHDLTAQWTSLPVVRATLSFKYLWYPPIFQVCNNRNHSQRGQSPLWLGTYERACGICFDLFTIVNLSSFFPYRASIKTYPTEERFPAIEIENGQRLGKWKPVIFFPFTWQSLFSYRDTFWKVTADDKVYGFRSLAIRLSRVRLKKRHEYNLSNNLVILIFI